MPVTALDYFGCIIIISGIILSILSPSDGRDQSNDNRQDDDLPSICSRVERYTTIVNATKLRPQLHLNHEKCDQCPKFKTVYITVKYPKIIQWSKQIQECCVGYKEVRPLIRRSTEHRSASPNPRTITYYNNQQNIFNKAPLRFYSFLNKKGVAIDKNLFKSESKVTNTRKKIKRSPRKNKFPKGGRKNRAPIINKNIFVSTPPSSIFRSRSSSGQQKNDKSQHPKFIKGGVRKIQCVPACPAGCFKGDCIKPGKCQCIKGFIGNTCNQRKKEKVVDTISDNSTLFKDLWKKYKPEIQKIIHKNIYYPAKTETNSTEISTSVTFQLIHPTSTIKYSDKDHTPTTVQSKNTTTLLKTTTTNWKPTSVLSTRSPPNPSTNNLPISITLSPKNYPTSTFLPITHPVSTVPHTTYPVHSSSSSSFRSSVQPPSKYSTSTPSSSIMADYTVTHNTKIQTTLNNSYLVSTTTLLPIVLKKMTQENRNILLNESKNLKTRKYSSRPMHIAPGTSTAYNEEYLLIGDDDNLHLVVRITAGVIFIAIMLIVLIIIIRILKKRRKEKEVLEMKSLDKNVCSNSSPISNMHSLCLGFNEQDSEDQKANSRRCSKASIVSDVWPETSDLILQNSRYSYYRNYDHIDDFITAETDTNPPYSSNSSNNSRDSSTLVNSTSSNSQWYDQSSLTTPTSDFSTDDCSSNVSVVQINHVEKQSIKPKLSLHIPYNNNNNIEVINQINNSRRGRQNIRKSNDQLLQLNDTMSIKNNNNYDKVHADPNDPTSTYDWLPPPTRVVETYNTPALLDVSFLFSQYDVNQDTPTPTQNYSNSPFSNTFTFSGEDVPPPLPPKRKKRSSYL